MRLIRNLWPGATPLLKPILFRLGWLRLRERMADLSHLIFNTLDAVEEQIRENTKDGAQQLYTIIGEWSSRMFVALGKRDS